MYPIVTRCKQTHINLSINISVLDLHLPPFLFSAKSTSINVCSNISKINIKPKQVKERVCFNILTLKGIDNTYWLVKNINFLLHTWVCFVFQSFSKTTVMFLEKKRSFFRTTHSFWTIKKRITIVLENDGFLKNYLWPFFIRLFFNNDRFWKKIVYEI